jgi:hypothetical protein
MFSPDHVVLILGVVVLILTLLAAAGLAWLWKL